MIIVNKYIGLKKKIVWSSVYIIYASTYWLLKKLLKDSSLNETTACVSAKMLGIKKKNLLHFEQVLGWGSYACIFRRKSFSE